ncbi:EAL domain-containing protein [Sphingomonas sp. H160509]|uniref:putative bifunctional diguanylate cyclase/phosphodiesterase n=1 Tax=Sphingomonas sp. H160509 TaxID=2955313 RepID=UPI002097EB3D|nr:EAL domain-containing protein [Sphingomonas sp. H160509]MDD1453171.1 EAL domain-containing protein [Sphingomonas sp. H160509]
MAYWKFTIEPPGHDVHGLYLGFRHLDDISLMRKIVATPSSATSPDDTTWLLLMGMFAGTLLSALLYNAVIHTGQRHAFQRWYLLWVAVALAYGLTWTNVAAFVVPGLVGPLVVRLDFVLIGLMVAAGNMFFFAVIEEGILPQPLVTAGRLLSGAGAVLGLMAAADMWLPVVLTDRLLNYVIAATGVIIAGSCWIAVRRGSRVIWFYLIGWGPVICVFLARLARNLGFLPQSDAVDMATFAALAFEALILSLAIADRFHLMRGELELAHRRREIAITEAETLRTAAETDFLTGLGNRSAFHEKAHAFVSSGTPFGLFLVDVDFLKAANDHLGHAGGDALLRCVASALSATAGQLQDALVARVGGDEFAILCPGDLSAESALASAIAALQGETWNHADENCRISLSVGSARFPDDGKAVDILFQNADLGLYTAKRLGRARYCRYDPLHRALRDLQTGFTLDAEAALKRGEFRLYMQPIVSLATGTVCGYEALLRWNHPQYGLMTPDRFADVLVAERIGLRIQEHVLELALHQLREHADQIGVLSVNFTSAQLTGPHAGKQVLDRLAHYGVSAESLCIEVTEGVMLDRAADSILANLQMLHDAGVCIALDDFGTGYASLVHLRRVTVDRIKIDRSFVSGMDQPNGGATAIVTAIIGLGRGLGKVVVAEGIETEAQAICLRQLGCQLGQGFSLRTPRCATSGKRGANCQRGRGCPN